MKKITKMLLLPLFLGILVSFTSVNAQDVVVLKHTNYTSHFSKSKHYPVMVEWWMTKAKAGCANQLARKDNFKPDPLLPVETDLSSDYVGSGTDRGHNMPAAENQCQTPLVQDECFYFSNMTPQYHSLNAGDWKSLEVLERQIAVDNDSVHIWCGSIGEAKKVGKVSVPTECWKVLYIVKTKEWMAYEFKNTTDKPSGLNTHKVTVADITKLTGLKFTK
jgi:endonuclease G, mitochondrial